MEKVSLGDYATHVSCVYGIETAEKLLGMSKKFNREVSLPAAERALERILRRH